jgi:HEAT repeat protein
VTFGVLTVVEAGWISLALIVVWLFVAGAVYREYVRSFRTGLKQRTVDATAPINVTDAETLAILVESLGSVDRRQVLHGLELLAAHGRSNLVPPLLLYHDDPDVRLETLRILRGAGRADALPLIERRLADDDPRVRAEAIRALCDLQGTEVGRLMRPRLHDGDLGVRAAAIAALAGGPDPDTTAEVESALAGMIADADPQARAEAAKAIGSIAGERYRPQLVRLLYDSRPEVARAAIGSVRRLLARDGFDPLYPPLLISLLRDRRLKHESRESLVALGESVLPLLAHFMNDPQESPWVRRALPKTIARIGTRAAADLLVAELRRPGDAFLHRKVIEALVHLRAAHPETIDREAITGAIRREVHGYLLALARLDALGGAAGARLDGPLPVWSGADEVPGLLDRLLAERMEDHLQNVFGLLALLHPPRDVRAAHRSLLAAASRSHALEYLDNVLSGEVRRLVFAAVGDVTREERFRTASRMFGIRRGTKLETLCAILTWSPEGERASSLQGAALYAIYLERIDNLYPQVAEIRARATDPFVRETAAWISGRLQLAPAS